jgi:3-methylcrotonyl-CoA carboxylase alpha subunit
VALARLDRALAQTRVAGTVTNLAFLGALTRHAGFASGDVDTGLIGRDIDRLVVPAEPEPRHMVAAGMVALGMTGGDWATGFTLWEPLVRAVTLAWQEDPFELQMRAEGPDRQCWTVDGQEIVAQRFAGQWQIDGAPMPETARAAHVVTVFDAYGLAFDIIDPLERAAGAAGDGNLIEAPMPGLVKAVFADVGQAVQAGDRLAVLEAMKMEHALLAARDGVVAEVLAAAGAQVEAGAALVRLEPEET